MRKKIDNNILFSTTFYPCNRVVKCVKNRVVIGIGCNIAECKRRFKKLYFYLKSHRLIDVVKTSMILKNPPFGYKNQDDFLNAVILVSTSLRPKRLLFVLQKMEKRFKRKKLIFQGPRTLDLDIIFYNNINYKSRDLIIPHPHWKSRDSVKIPLSTLS
jgi:2-amino-4-hydroxy-6-hydroxymethyldihydropteridine diphosphokinase